MKDLITVAVFTYYHEITVIRHLLDQNDIPYTIVNETLVSVFPFSSYAFGGIQLKVHPEFVKAVEEILKGCSGSSDHLRIV